MKRIFVFDLDNTILFFNEKINDYVIYPETIKLLQKIKKDKNNILILASGRMRYNKSGYKKINKYFDYFIYLNGGIILKKNELIKNQGFLKEEVLYLYHKAIEKNTYVEFSSMKYFYAINDNFKDIDSFHSKHLKIIKSTKELTNKKLYSAQIIKDEVDDEIKEKFSVFPWKTKGAHVLNKHVNKASFINKLKNEFKETTLISIGDGINDIEVFKISNISISFSDSKEIVKNNANYIIKNKEKLYTFYKENKFI